MIAWLGFLSICLIACDMIQSNAALDQNASIEPTSEQTITPEVTDQSTNTLVPRSSPQSKTSPTQVSTATTTLTPTNTVLSTLEAGASVGEIPKWSSALLFISEQNLMRWDPFTNYVSLISENVLEYSASRNGRLVALLRSRNMVANGIGMYELSILDFDSKQINPIIEQTTRLYSLSMSPNGEWIAYYPQKNGGRLTLIRSDDSDERLELGFCHQDLNTPCDPVSWSADNRSVLWSDQRGLWLTQLDWDAPKLITMNMVEFTDPAGVVSTIQVTFDSLVWSPKGRYAIAEIVPSASIARWYVVIDTRREEFEEVPNSFQAGTEAGNTVWLSDGLLAVGHLNKTGDEPNIMISIYEVVPTHPGIFLAVKELRLYKEDGVVIPETSLAPDNNIFIDWMQQPNTQIYNLFFGVRLLTETASPTLYQLFIEDERLQFVNTIPQLTDEVLWASDLSGALLIGENSDYYFQPLGEEKIKPLSQIFGKDATGFTWLPPSLR